MAPPVLHRVIYGSSDPQNLNVPQAQADVLRIRPAILHAYQRHKVKNADYPAILPSNESSSVRGTLVSGLTDGDIWRLDIFEGSEYERKKVKVCVLEQSQNEGMGDVNQAEADNVEGEELEAEVYVWTASPNRLEPQEWDFAEFVRDKMSRWVGREASDMDEGFQGRQSINGMRVRACRVHIL